MYWRSKGRSQSTKFEGMKIEARGNEKQDVEEDRRKKCVKEAKKVLTVKNRRSNEEEVY